MKKLLLLIIALLTSLALIACSGLDFSSDGGNGEEEPGSGDTDGGDGGNDDSGNNNDNSDDGTADGGNDDSGNNNDNSGDGTADGGNDGDNSGSTTPENVIFGYGINPVIIRNLGDFDTINESAIDSLALSIRDLGVTMPVLLKDTSTEREHEIVLGSTARPISIAAEDVFRTKMKNSFDTYEDKGINSYDLAGFMIYSDGKSVAVVWSDFQIAPIAIEYFEKNYIDTTEDGALILEAGYTKTEFFSLSTYLKEREEKILEEKWAAFSEALPEEYREDIVREFKNLYTLYTGDMVVWLANLYDPEVGGWYHSNSARDDTQGFDNGLGSIVQYQPDIENTYVALMFVEMTGMAEMFGNDWVKAMPDWLKEDVGSWIYSLQDEDGFFYNPQWPKEYIQAGNRQSRITRDRGSAKTLLRRLGMSAKYAGYTPSENAVPAPLGGSTVVAVSKVVYASEMLWQYESEENFDEYLAGFEADLVGLTDAERAYKFYYWGNLFQSTTSYMTPTMKTKLIAFFDKHQNPENGTWAEGLYYNSTNGIHKLAAVYNSCGAPLKHVDKMIESAMEIVMWDVQTKPARGVEIYNAWSCFPYVYTNIRNYSSGTSAEREARCEEIKAIVFEKAAAAIRIAYDQLVDTRLPDGSFGYDRGYSSTKAQGCHAAVSGSKEGDVNGNALSSYDIVHYITLALELEKWEIPLFTEEDRYVFVNTICENAGKNPLHLEEDRLYDFEDTEIGELPEGLKVTIDANRNEIPGSQISVIDNGTNKLLSFTMRNRGDDTNGRNYNLSVPAQNVNEYATRTRLEMDITVSDTTQTSTNICELTFSKEKKNGCVIQPRLGRASGGTISIYDTSGALIGAIGSVNEKIELVIEYIPEYGIYNVFSSGRYVGCGSATYGGTEHAIAGRVGIGSASTITADFTVDNLRIVNIK